MKTRTSLSTAILLAAALALPALAASQETGQPPFRNKIEAEGILSIQGECRILTTDNGTRYVLTGELSAFKDGDRLFVRGPAGEKSACLENAVTIAVVDAERREPTGSSGTQDAPQGQDQEATVTHVEVQGKAVAKPGKTIVVQGVLTAEGVECQALRADDGTLYTLAGKTEGFQVGDKVKVTGKVAEVSICQQGITLDVQNIKRVEKEKK